MKKISDKNAFLLLRIIRTMKRAEVDGLDLVAVNAKRRASALLKKLTKQWVRGSD